MPTHAGPSSHRLPTFTSNPGCPPSAEAPRLLNDADVDGAALLY